MAQAQRLITADYNGLSNKPIINASLPVLPAPPANTYFRHTGSTTGTFTNGVIYKWDGTEYKELGTGAQPIDLSKYIQADTLTGLLPNVQYALVHNSDNVFTLVEVEGGEGGTGWFTATTDAEVEALLINENLGKFFMFIGTSEDYMNYALYQIVDNEGALEPALIYVSADDIESLLNDKQDVATLEQDVAALGFTKNAGTLTGIIMNDSAVQVENGVANLGTVITEHQSLDDYYTKSEVDASLDNKQDTLESGVNIKTINNQSILGEGDIEIGGGTDDYNELENQPIINQYETTDVEFVKFKSGQVLVDGDKIHFDTTKGDELATYLAGLTYDGDDQAYLIFDDAEESPLLALDLAGFESSGYILAILSTESAMGLDILYATEAGTFGTVPYKQGFNNLDVNGDYTIDFGRDVTIATVNDTDPETWNGVIIGLQEETVEVSPAPVNGKYYKRPDGDLYRYTAGKETLDALEDGQVIPAGDKIHFDKSKTTDLDDLMNNAEYPSQGGALALFKYEDTSEGRFELGFLDAEMDNPENPGTPIYGPDAHGKLLVAKTGDILYATESGKLVVPDAGIEITYTQGFNSELVDANGDYILSSDSAVSITLEDMIDADLWNGVIIGIQEVEPAFYDKVVLESELTPAGGSDNNGFYNASVSMPQNIPAFRRAVTVPETVETTFGYYYNDAFYYDAEHTSEISPQSGRYYIDLGSSPYAVYTWNDSKSLYELSQFMYNGLYFNTESDIDFTALSAYLTTDDFADFKYGSIIPVPISRLTTTIGEDSLYIFAGYIKPGTLFDRTVVTEGVWLIIVTNRDAEDITLEDIIYASGTVSTNDGIISKGWNISADMQSGLESLNYFVDDGESLIRTMSDFVRTVYSVDNQWEIVPEQVKSIDKDKIDAGDKELAVGDMVVDNAGALSKITNFSTRSVSHRNPTNPIEVNDTLTQLVFDTAATPDYTLFNQDELVNTGFVPGWNFLMNTNGDAILQGWFIAAGSDVEGLHFDNEEFGIVGLGGEAPIYLTAGLASAFGMSEGWQSGMITQFNEELTSHQPVIASPIYAQDIWGGYISKDGQWEEGQVTIIDTVEYDRVIDLAKKSDIKTPLYFSLAGKPIEQRLGEDFNGSSSDRDKYIQAMSDSESESSYIPEGGIKRGVIYYFNGGTYMPITGESSGSGLPDITDAKADDVLKIKVTPAEYESTDPIYNGNSYTEIFVKIGNAPDFSKLVYNNTDYESMIGIPVCEMFKGTANIEGTDHTIALIAADYSGVKMLILLSDSSPLAFIYLSQPMESIPAGWNTNLVDLGGYANILQSLQGNTLTLSSVDQQDGWKSFIGASYPFTQISPEVKESVWGTPYPEVKANEQVFTSSCEEYPLQYICKQDVKLAQSGQFYFNVDTYKESDISLLAENTIEFTVEYTKSTPVGKRFAIKFMMASEQGGDTNPVIVKLSDLVDTNWTTATPIYAPVSGYYTDTQGNIFSNLQFNEGWQNINSCSWSEPDDYVYIEKLHSDYQGALPIFGSILTTVEDFFYGEVRNQNAGWQSLRTINGESIFGSDDLTIGTQPQDNFTGLTWSGSGFSVPSDLQDWKVANLAIFGNITYNNVSSQFYWTGIVSHADSGNNMICRQTVLLLSGTSTIPAEMIIRADSGSIWVRICPDLSADTYYSLDNGTCQMQKIM